MSVSDAVSESEGDGCRDRWALAYGGGATGMSVLLHDGLVK